MLALGTTLGLGVTLFVATNIDDIFLLLALFADPRLKPRQIVAGQLLGMTVLVVASAAASAVAVALAARYVAVLGCLPLAIGISQLVRRLRGAASHDDDSEPPGLRGAGKVAAISSITIANGGDNLGIYVPAFATRSHGELAVLGASFLLLTCVWCWLGHYLVHHPKLGAPLRKYAGPVTPFVLIALGLYILADLLPTGLRP